VRTVHRVATNSEKRGKRREKELMVLSKVNPDSEVEVERFKGREVLANTQHRWGGKSLELKKQPAVQKHS